MPTAILPKFKSLHCPKCKRLYTFQRAYFEAEAPLKIQCPTPGCDWFDVVADESDTRYAHLPKIDPSIASQGYWIIEGSSDLPQIVQDAATDIGSTPAELRQESFSRKLDSAAVAFLSGFQIIAEIKQNLSTIADEFKEEIEIIHSQGSSFRLGWDQSLLPHFLLHPFMKVPAFPLDTEIADQTCFLIAPKFYTRLHGIPLATKGGFYLQLITPYSQMHFLLESWMRVAIEYPAALDLRYEYSKIVGRSLADCWSKMEGVVLDEDHSKDNPSVLVENKRLARQWMVKHGLPGFPPLKINTVDLYPSPISWIMKGEERSFAEALDRFLKYGRLALAWKDVAAARSFVLYAGGAFKGFKLIISGNAEDAKRMSVSNSENWRATSQQQVSGRQDFLWHHWSEFATLEGFNDFDIVVVDVASGVPMQFLEKLHHYSGPLILILADPLMDTLEENEIAPAVYALCNSVHYYAGKQAWENAWVELSTPLSEGLCRAIESLFR